jgi:hypothetical protein
MIQNLNDTNNLIQYVQSKIFNYGSILNSQQNFLKSIQSYCGATHTFIFNDLKVGFINIENGIVLILEYLSKINAEIVNYMKELLEIYGNDYCVRSEYRNEIFLRFIDDEKKKVICQVTELSQ